jgi:glycosyltransferase involved in cell wall biosynthesis
VPPNDAAALADRLRSALGLSPGERAAMSARASARARAEFALSQMQRKTLAVYDELLGSNLAEAFSR